jgi:hypothetical protein
MDLFSKMQIQINNQQVGRSFHHRCDLILGFLAWRWIFGPCQNMCVDALYSPEDAKEPWLWSLVGAVWSLVDRFGNGGDWDSESSFDYTDYFGGPPSTNVAFLTKPGLQSTMLKQNAQVVELAQDVILQWLGAGGNQSQETRKALRSQAVSSWVTRSMITGTILTCIPHGATLLLVDSVWFVNAHAKARVFPQILVTSRHGVSQKLWTKFVQDLCKSPICDLGSEEQTVLQELEATSVSAAAMLGIPDLQKIISSLPHSEPSLLNTLPHERLDMQLKSHRLYVKHRTAPGPASASASTSASASASASTSALSPSPAPTMVGNSVQRAALKVIIFLEVVQPLLEGSSAVQRPHVGHVAGEFQQEVVQQIAENLDKFSPFREKATTRSIINCSPSNPFRIEHIKTVTGFFSAVVTRVIFGSVGLLKDQHGLLYSSKEDWQMVKDRWGGAKWCKCGSAYGSYSYQIVDDKAPATWWEVAEKWQQRWSELDRRGQDVMPWKEAI